MKLFTVILILMTIHGDINKIAEINRLKKEAARDYLNKDYKDAAVKYQTLVDSLGQEDDELHMKLSHCNFHLGDTTRAISNYKQLTQSDQKPLQSVAWQQLGILNAQARNFSEAENDFVNSLRANPDNDEARYNYELLKKKIRNQQKKEQGQQQNGQKDKQKQQNQNPQQADKQNQAQKDKTNQKGQELNNDQFKMDKISRQKAQMILDAMRNTEEQYLQQLKRKSTKKPDSDKPDW